LHAADRGAADQIPDGVFLVRAQRVFGGRSKIAAGMGSEHVPRYDADYNGASLRRGVSVKCVRLLASHTLNGLCQLSSRMTRDELNQHETDPWSAADNLHANEMENFDSRPWAGFEE
jgi:hypothetical protein